MSTSIPAQVNGVAASQSTVNRVSIYATQIINLESTPLLYRISRNASLGSLKIPVGSHETIDCRFASRNRMRSDLAWARIGCQPGLRTAGGGQFSRAAAGSVQRSRSAECRSEVRDSSGRRIPYALLLPNREWAAIANSAPVPRRDSEPQGAERRPGAAARRANRDRLDRGKHLRLASDDRNLGQRALPWHQHLAGVRRGSGDPYLDQLRRQLQLPSAVPGQ